MIYGNNCVTILVIKQRGIPEFTARPRLWLGVFRLTNLKGLKMISRNFASRLFVVTLMVVLLSAFAFAPVQAAPAGQGVRILPKAQEAPIDWSADFVLGLISAGMSLVFAYLPYLKEWYDSLDSRTKPLVMLILITVLVWGKLALTCAFDWSCIQAGAGEAFLLWMGCLVANSQTYEKFIRQQKQAAREKARVELQNRLGVTSR